MQRQPNFHGTLKYAVAHRMGFQKIEQGDF